MKRIRPIHAAVVMTVFPFVALALLASVIFNWRVPAAYIVVMALLTARWRARPRDGSKVRASAEFIAFVFIGDVIGAFALGDAGAIFGAIIGFSFRLGEVTVTRGRSFAILRRGRRH